MFQKLLGTQHQQYEITELLFWPGCPPKCGVFDLRAMKEKKHMLRSKSFLGACLTGNMIYRTREISTVIATWSPDHTSPLQGIVQDQKSM
jgi:hypothetical protein